ncbi:MAG TPA: hypothetical protein VGO96_08500 [Pyrinomonadaceae bacterium]|nr:hypothetical protein [Pyrinomonadaceae bacterium]
MAAVAAAQTTTPGAKPKPPGLPPKSSIVTDPKSAQPDLGTIQNSVYTNEFFNLRIPVPAGWNIHDEAGKRRIMQTGNEELSAAKPETSQSLNKSLERTLNLLAFDNLNLPSGDGGAAALLVGAERIPAGQTMSVLQYMETTKRLVMGVSGYETVEDIHMETIGGAECSAMTMKRAMPGITLKQKYIGIIRKGYAIFLVTAYTNENAGRKLDDVLKQSKLN